MPHISTNNNIPGIRGLFEYSPDTAIPMKQLVEILMRRNADSSLTQWERELIATYVSHLNKCEFCYQSHAAIVKHLNTEKENIVEAVINDYTTAPISEKLKTLLNIADKVQKEARKVLPADIEKAKQAGATEKEIHDAVLIAAAFCMYNKYVDGLDTRGWDTTEQYFERAKLSAEEGYFKEMNYGV